MTMEHKCKKDYEYFCQSVQVQMQEVVETLDYPALERAAELICTAKRDGNRLHISGIGKPAHLAGYLASLFRHAGLFPARDRGRPRFLRSARTRRCGDLYLQQRRDG